MRGFHYKVVKNTRAPGRSTQPHSSWRRAMNCMKPGHWFELPKKDHSKVQSSAAKYCKGRYSLYRHPARDGFYIFLRTK